MATRTYTDLAIRLDGQDPSDLINFLDEDGGAYLVVKEVADGNHHFHAVVRTSRSVQAFRMAFRRSLPDLNGNGSYSIATVRDLDKYHRYMCKGDADGVWPEVVGANGIQYADIAWQNEQHAAYWEENARLAGERRKEPVVDAVLRMAREARLRWSDREALAKLFIKEMADRGKGINPFQIRASINLVSIKLCPDDSAIDQLAGVVAAF